MQARRRARFKGNPSSTEIEDVVESLSSKMESAPDADGPGVRRSLNNELAVIEEKPGKRSKNIRKWKAGQMPETNTPVRAGTDIKTPSRPRIHERKITETVKETVDVVVMDIEEQVKDLKAAVSELEDKLYECQDDQQAFRRQQLWSLKSQIGDQRAAAAKEECFVGWPNQATSDQRSQFVLWCLQAAGLSAEMCQISHTAKSSELSRMSIVYFKQSWVRAQLDKWFKDEYINKKRPLNFYVNGTHTNDQMKMRPQIGLWGRLKAEPIKIVLKALDIAHEKGQLRTDLSKLKPYWGHDAIHDDYYTYCWVHFSVRDVRATVFLDNTIFQNVADHWMEALDEVGSGNNKGQANKGKGKGKGKSKTFDTPAGNYPFDYKLASVQDWRYDEHVNKRKEDEDSLDS